MTHEGHDTWSNFQYDAANTGHAPNNTGPIANVGEKWRDSGEYDFHASQAAVADGTVYKIRRDGIAAHNAETGAQEWFLETGSHFSKASPTVWNGTVYAPSGHGGIHAINAAEGTEEWFFSTLEGIDTDATSERNYAITEVVDGTIFVGGDEVSKTLYAVDAETGDELWRFEAPVLIRATPAVSDGTVYLPTGPFLIAVDATDGTEEWRYETGAHLTASPTVAAVSTGDDSTREMVYVGGNFLHHAVDADTGEQVWTTETGASSNGVAQAVADGTVYASSSSGLFALDAETGQKQWDGQWEVSEGAGPPVVVGDTVYFVRGGSETEPQRVYGIDASTGEQRWEVASENLGGFPSGLVVASSSIYTALGNIFYAFEGDAPEPDSQTPSGGSEDTETRGEGGSGSDGGPPLVPIGIGGLLAAVLVVLLVLFRRRDHEEDEQ